MGIGIAEILIFLAVVAMLITFAAVFIFAVVAVAKRR